MNLHLGLARAFMIERGWRWGVGRPGIVRYQLTPLETAARKLATKEWQKAQSRAWYAAHREQARASQRARRASAAMDMDRGERTAT